MSSSHLSPLDILKQQLAGAAMSAVTDVATAGINQTKNVIKNAVSNSLNGMSGNRPVNNPARSEVIDVKAEEDEDTDDEDTDDEDTDDEDNTQVRDRDPDSPTPFYFDCFDPDKNLSCAAAVWRIWGLKDFECGEDDQPDIVAQNEKTGLTFVGTILELKNFSEHNDLDDDWMFYGADFNEENETTNYDSSEISDIKVSKDIIKYVTMQLSAVNSDEYAASEQTFKDFHWDKNEKPANGLVVIPFMEGVRLAMLGVAQAIIYTAKKGGEVQTFIHEFGEDSGLKPTLYSLPTPDGEKFPRAMLISGGNTRVEPRGIVD